MNTGERTMIATLKAAALRFAPANRFEQLFAMSETQLSTRGFDRDALVRGYISGLGLN